MRVALVGAGGMGGVHLNVYQVLEDVELVAVVDIDTDKAEKKLKDNKLEAAVYGDYDKMLADENIDMVDICTPTYLHPEQAIKAMKRGIHVLSEKPISVTVAEAENMVETAEENDVLFMVAQVIRFWPEYKYLKEAIEDERFGKLKQLLFSRISSRPRWSFENWMLDGEKSGRVPVDLHVHDVDFLYYVLGTPEAVNSYGKEEGEIISYITTHYEYGGQYKGIPIEIEGGWYDAPYPFTMSFRAVFEEAVLNFNGDKLMIYEIGKEERKAEIEDTATIKSDINISSINGYYNEIKYFIDCIKKGQKPQITTPESTIEVLKIIYKELESVERGERIKI